MLAAPGAISPMPAAPRYQLRYTSSGRFYTKTCESIMEVLEFSGIVFGISAAAGSWAISPHWAAA